MTAQASLLSELESAVQAGSSAKRLATLRLITDLFLADSDRLSTEQVDLFDEVLGYLIKSIEGKALAQLSTQLAPVDNAPKHVVQRLARDDEISVAGPILAHSNRLDPADLVEIARTKGQAHLLAISGRAQLDTAVTDVLVDRGNGLVVERLVDNNGAEFSGTGFAKLAERAASDQAQLERLAKRRDLPLPVFRNLMQKATDLVRTRLLISLPPERQEELRRALAKATTDVDRDMNIGRDREGAERKIQHLQEQGQLDLSILMQAAKADEFEEVRAAIAAMLAVPLDLIDRLMLSRRRDAWLVLFKAADVDILIVLTILQMPSFPHGWAEGDERLVRNEYGKLSVETAQRVLRFWKVRQSTT